MWCFNINCKSPKSNHAISRLNYYIFNSILYKWSLKLKFWDFRMLKLWVIFPFIHEISPKSLYWPLGPSFSFHMMHFNTNRNVSYWNDRLASVWKWCVQNPFDLAVVFEPWNYQILKYYKISLINFLAKTMVLES